MVVYWYRNHKSFFFHFLFRIISKSSSNGGYNIITFVLNFIIVYVYICKGYQMVKAILFVDLVILLIVTFNSFIVSLSNILPYTTIETLT